MSPAPRPETRLSVRARPGIVPRVTTTLDPAALLAEHDAELRRGDRPLAGWHAEWDGPVLRHYSDTEAVVVFSRLTSSDADAAVANQRDWARQYGRSLEWKHYAHDHPADLPARLTAAGYAAEPSETVMVAAVDDLAERLAGTEPPPGVSLREASEPNDLARMSELGAAVWGEPVPDWSGTLAAETAAHPGSLRVVFAEAADGTLVCAARLHLHGHTATEAGPRWGSLWGGGTRPGWRGRGVYKSTVARRVDWAVEARCRWLVVDASSDSRPILQRLGFVPLTTTTPYVIGA